MEIIPCNVSAGIVGADYLIRRYTPGFVRIVLVLLTIPFTFIVVPFAIPVLNANHLLNISKSGK